MNSQNIFAFQHHLSFRALAWVKVVHVIEHAQQRRFSTSRRPDKRGDPVGEDRHRYVLERRVPILVIKIQISDAELFVRGGALFSLRDQITGHAEHGVRFFG